MTIAIEEVDSGLARMDGQKFIELAIQTKIVDRFRLSTFYVCRSMMLIPRLEPGKLKYFNADIVTSRNRRHCR